MIPTDPLYAQQWHFGQIGNIQRIWDDYRGAGVSVVVYDDGVEAGHRDLAGNFDPSAAFLYNGNTYDAEPLFSDAAHGTAVSGLIGARAGNGVGGVGVAFEVTLAGVNYLDDLQDYHDPARPAAMRLYEAAMRHAGQFDVMSNSWGWSDYYSRFQSLAIDSYARRDVALFAEVSVTGRGGLGTVVVKSAGNDARDTGGDGWQVSRHTITVAATVEDGFAADYSNHGASVLIAAPDASVTTDLTGGDGYNRTNRDFDPAPLDYTTDFGGTSASAPVVSGVVALMLDANDGLGWRDVQTILTLSAGHTGSAYDASDASVTEVGTWAIAGDSNWNGGGRAFHASYGFGIVDAFAAVRMAEAWAAFGVPAQTSGNEVTARFGSNQRVVAQDADPGASNPGQTDILLTTAQAISVETVYVSIRIEHQQLSDLSLTLIAPDGSEALIVDLEDLPDRPSGALDWVFAVEAFRGLNAAGTWTVRVEDWVDNALVGTVTRVALDVFGATATTDDLHHFTDDFLTLAALDPDRRVLGDANGGTDWASFAAIAGNITANMNPTGAVYVNGALWTRMAAGLAEIENLHAGDGDDAITGNTLANRILGARGADAIKGNAGADTLDGGVGQDNLNGGSQADLLLGGEGRDVLVGAGGHDTLTGGLGEDAFLFAGVFGRDLVTDFQDNIDTLRLDDALWGGGLNVRQVLTAHGGLSAAGDVTLTFGTSVLTLAGITAQASLLDDILIV